MVLFLQQLPDALDRHAEDPYRFAQAVQLIVAFEVPVHQGCFLQGRKLLLAFRAQAAPPDILGALPLIDDRAFGGPAFRTWGSATHAGNPHGQGTTSSVARESGDQAE